MAYVLKIYFAGTGDCAMDVKQACKKRDVDLLDVQEEEHIVRVYFSGCQDRAIGGRSLFLGYLSPDLNVVTRKLRRCFLRNNGVFFNASLLKKIFSDSVLFDDVALFNTNSIDSLTNVEVSHIHLYGYSRGAVTTFLVGKALNDLAIDMEIFAEEPIPGESKAGFKKALVQNSVCRKAYHLDNCQYIKKATIMLGDHSQIEETNVLYRQMSPTFHRNTQAGIYLIPKNKHSCFGLFGEKQFLRYLVPDSTVVQASYFNYLMSLGLNELCAYLKLKSLQKDSASLDDFSDLENDDGLDTVSVNDMFYGTTIRVQFLLEPVFLPRSLKKSYHFGVLGRVQNAPSIKQWFHLKHQAFYLEPTRFRLMQYQALCALCVNAWDRPKDHFSALIQRICDESGDLSENIALRDFIIEINRTFNYFKQKAPHLPVIMDNCIHSVWQNLEESILLELGNHWRSVHACLNDLLKANRKAIGTDCFNDLLISLRETIKTCALYHPTLVKYLKPLDDEGMAFDLSKAQNHAFDDEPKTSFEFIRNVFYSTPSRRKILFDAHKQQLDLFSLSIENVVDLSILLEFDQATELLKRPVVKQLIDNVPLALQRSHIIDKIPVKLRGVINTDNANQRIEFRMENASLST